MPALTVPRIVFVVLTMVLVLLQIQIWTGHGSVHSVAEMKSQLAHQQERNAQLEQEIARTQSEIQDLKEGLSTVEEKARYEMGMVKQNELFVQIAR